MLFSSITFLFAFLAVVLLVYYVSPKSIKNFVLMIFSLMFYAWGEPKYIVVMLITIIVGYILGLLTDYFRQKDRSGMAKVMVTLAVIINLGILFFFKYTGFFAENLNLIPGIEVKMPKFSLPLGISFYTFQILSYSVDVYRQTAKPQRNIINLAAYITLFPQLIAGPIVRYETVADELINRKSSVDDFGEGVKRFITGLGKKVLIANMAGEIVKELTGLSADKNTVILSWVCAIAYTLQIYFDFSGYSDMAIGLGRMFGFHFLENFNYPYISRSITEFWRRWHISLSSWFRDYVYIPLGGNRRGKLIQLRNMLMVWLLTGFWHGAEWNFVIWGMYYFVLLMVEKLGLGKVLNKMPKPIGNLYTLFFVNLGWVIFAYDNMGELAAMLKNMFGMNGLTVSNTYTMYVLASYGIFLLIAAFAATPYPKKIGSFVVDRIEGVYESTDDEGRYVKERLCENENKVRFIMSSTLETVFLFMVFVLSTAFLASEAFNPFLYFRF